MCWSFSAACGFKLHPQWLCHANAAHCGICWFRGILHLQVQKVCLFGWVGKLSIINIALCYPMKMVCLSRRCRKIPWINVQTEEINEKEQEVISTVGQKDIMSKVKLSDFSSQKELMEREQEARSRGMCGKRHDYLPPFTIIASQNTQKFKLWKFKNSLTKKNVLTKTVWLNTSKNVHNGTI